MKARVKGLIDLVLGRRRVFELDLNHTCRLSP